MRVVSLPSQFNYSGSELAALEVAENYYAYILHYFRPFLGPRVLEVGAGIGTFALACLRTGIPRDMVLVEPAENNLPILRERFADHERVTVQQGYVEDLISPEPFDTAVAVNVLEHVEHEQGFLEGIRRLLVPGGHLLLFVPALPILYGALDDEVEHFRRYTRKSLAAATRKAGLEPVMDRYVNAIGIIPWFISGRILRRRTINPAHVRFYDRFVMPVIRSLEVRWEPPVGQSLLAVLRRPMTG